MQQIKLLLRNPNSAGSYVSQGGVAGQYISCDANLDLAARLTAAGYATFGMRTTYYALGCVDGTTLIYGHYIGTGRIGGIGEAGRNEAYDLTVPALCGFHLYPGAEIVANLSTGFTPQLEPNAVAWAAGDVVENPHPANFGGRAAWINPQQFSPTSQQFGSNGLLLLSSGTGITGSYQPLTVQNLNPFGQYQGSSLNGVAGPLSAPSAATIIGPYKSILTIDTAPFSIVTDRDSAVIKIFNPPNSPTTPFNLWSLPSNGRVFVAAYYPALGRLLYPKVGFGGRGAGIHPHHKSSHSRATAAGYSEYRW